MARARWIDSVTRPIVPRPESAPDLVRRPISNLCPPPATRAYAVPPPPARRHRAFARVPPRRRAPGIRQWAGDDTRGDGGHEAAGDPDPARRADRCRGGRARLARRRQPADRADVALHRRDRARQRADALQRDPRRALRPRHGDGVVRRRALRDRPRRQLRHRHRAGVPRQAEARPVGPAQRPDDARRARRRGAGRTDDRRRAGRPHRAAHRRRGPRRRHAHRERRSRAQRGEPHRRVRPRAARRGRRHHVGYERRRGVGPLPREPGRGRRLRQPDRCRRTEVHAHALGDPGLDQHPADLHHVGHRRRPADRDLVAVADRRRPGLARGRHPVGGGRRRPRARGPRAPHVGGLPPVGRAADPSQRPRAAAPGRRGPGPRRRRVPRQDGDADRRRDRVRGRAHPRRAGCRRDPLRPGRARRRPERQRHPDGGRRGRRTAGVGAHADDPVQLLAQVERGLLRGALDVGARCARGAARRRPAAVPPGGDRGDPGAGGRARRLRTPGRAARPQRGAPHRGDAAGRPHPGRPRDAHRAGAPGRAGDARLLRRAGRRHQGRLGRQPRDRRRRRPHRRARRRGAGRRPHPARTTRTRCVRPSRRTRSSDASPPSRSAPSSTPCRPTATSSR